MEHVIATCRAGRWQQRIEAVPPLAWLALHAAALWSHWRWAAARMADGSDDPLGVAALGVLLFAVLRLAPHLRGHPRPAWLGRLVIVDAPCSGVQMVWMAYFTACTIAAFSGLRERRFLARLPWVALIVLTGNVLRNSVLVLLEARQAALSAAVHELVGLAVLAAVCGGVAAVMRGAGDDTR
jgi:exosortase/archaeosortase family protein